jgi:TonB-dependent starch-binding outer membrane protein SusC
MIIKCVFKKGKKISFVIMLLLGLLTINQISAQTASTIKGIVKDETGLPMPGVNILEKGTKNAVSSDFDGKYSIKVSSEKSVLVFSYIGFDTKSVNVAGNKVLDVSIQSSTNKLNEIVVVGYGTSKKSDLTGSIATISGSDLRKVPTASIAESLTGRIAGVQVTATEGSPDAEVKIRIRGGGSLTQDASPLIIVDGFPVNSMNDVSPSDVENITVLKDASSTAIYGSRGANGVIIITTKKGKNNKIAVSYNGYLGTKTMAQPIQVLKSEDYVKWQYEYALLINKVDSYEKYYGKWQDYDLYKGVEGDDWQKQVYGNLGKVQSHDLGIRGGSDKVSYNFSYAHYDEKAIMVSSDFKRDNLSLNIQNKATEKIDLGFTVRYSNAVIGGGGANEQNEKSTQDSRLKHVVGYSPIPLQGLTTDDTDESVSSYLVQPFVAIADNDRTQERTNFNMLGSFGWKIIDNLQFKSDFGLDIYNNLDYRFYGRSTYYAKNAPPAALQGLSSVILNDEKDKRFRNANTLNYDFKNYIKGDHSLKLLLGEEMINYKSNSVTSTIQGFPTSFDFADALNLSSQGTPFSVNNYYMPDDKLLSFFSRANYDYKNRYLLTATFRADGSSKFLDENVWGYFPSIAGAWKVSEESFMKDVSWVNSLKTRLSYGQAGNNNIPVGQTEQYFASSGSNFINGVNNYWAAPKNLYNPDLKWETTTTLDFGIDYSILKNRVSGTVDVYKNVTSDLLMKFPIPGNGYDFQYRNMGETQNTGVELVLNVAAIQKEEGSLNFSFNVGFNKNKINSLGVMDNFTQGTGWAGTAAIIPNEYQVSVGQPIGIMIGYKNDGRYEVSDFDYTNGKYTLKTGVTDGANALGAPVVPGSMKLKDTNGDHIVDKNDIVVIGNANPKSTGGMVINGTFQNFDLMMAFNWSYGNDIYNANKIEFTSTTTDSPNGQYRNLTSQMADGKRWTNLDPESGTLVTDPTALAALNENTTMWSPYMKKFMFTDYNVEDGSFLRLNTFTFGYNTPDAIASRFGMSKLRFFTTMSNVFTITNYTGPDPEVSTRRQTALTPGVDYSAYPRSRQIIFGLNLSF